MITLIFIGLSTVIGRDIANGFYFFPFMVDLFFAVIISGYIFAAVFDELKKIFRGKKRGKKNANGKSNI